MSYNSDLLFYLQERKWIFLVFLLHIDCVCLLVSRPSHVLLTPEVLLHSDSISFSECPWSILSKSFTIIFRASAARLFYLFVQPSHHTRTSVSLVLLPSHIEGTAGLLLLLSLHPCSSSFYSILLVLLLHLFLYAG